MYALVLNSFKTTPAVRRILPCAFYHPGKNPLMSPQQQQQQQPQQPGSPQVHSTSKVDDFYINSTYPDDSETPPTMTQKRTSIHATSQWQETRSTQSEADVKADRGEAKSLDDIVEAEQEPRLDEM
ncbi:hypothetical protein ASPCAL07008 [Aspergillus calidoustus]|uniref:Uncharacterized protein n=1 Tax=Aspergillus calidoustus TaxID=454130 RepID=A0A0U5G6I6_ASPCI|nr:hypothetical protein ASPCAL07008 [Aspergillus calidoustus]